MGGVSRLEAEPLGEHEARPVVEVGGRLVAVLSSGEQVGIHEAGIEVITVIEVIPAPPGLVAVYEEPGGRRYEYPVCALRIEDGCYGTPLLAIGRGVEPARERDAPSHQLTGFRWANTKQGDP